MPYLFIDDGYPESAEFDNNYVWFNAADPKSLAALERSLPAGHRALVRAAESTAPGAPEKKSSPSASLRAGIRWNFFRR
jgi:hypothetical protein